MGLLDGWFGQQTQQPGLLSGLTGGQWNADPMKNQAVGNGLLTLGLSLMSTPGKLGQALGTAGLQGLQAYQGSLHNQRQQQMQDWQFQQMKQDADRKQQEFDRQQKMHGLASQFMQPGVSAPADATGGMETDASAPNNVGASRPGQFDFQGYSQALAQYDPMASLQLQASLRKDTTPIKVGAGESLVNPQTLLPMYTNPKESQVPEALRAIELVYGKGSPQYIQASQDYVRKLTTHQPSTTVNVNATKPLINEMAGGLGKQLDASLEGARTAANTVQTAQQMRGLLESGKLITGPGADTRILLQQIGSSFGVGGQNAEERLANTRTFMQGLAQSELQAAQAMKGQGQITENERALIQRAASGNINMTTPELRALVGAMEKTARYRISQHQANVQKLQGVPEAAALMPFYQIDMPPQSPTAQQSGLPSAEEIEAEIRRRGGR